MLEESNSYRVRVPLVNWYVSRPCDGLINCFLCLLLVSINRHGVCVSVIVRVCVCARARVRQIGIRICLRECIPYTRVQLDIPCLREYIVD